MLSLKMHPLSGILLERVITGIRRWSRDVRHHAQNDRGVAAAGRSTNQDKKANEHSEAIQRRSVGDEAEWAGTISTAAAQNEPKRAALPPQRGERDVRLTRRDRRPRLSGQGEAQNGNSDQ